MKRTSHNSFLDLSGDCTSQLLANCIISCLIDFSFSIIGVKMARREASGFFLRSLAALAHLSAIIVMSIDEKSPCRPWNARRMFSRKTSTSFLLDFASSSQANLHLLLPHFNSICRAPRLLAQLLTTRSNKVVLLAACLHGARLANLAPRPKMLRASTTHHI
jgi:hypothetical protein